MTFGHSLRFDDGDLVIDDGDLGTVTGRANLVQALTMRLLTPYGTDRFNTAYGLDLRQVLTGAHSRRTVRELLRLNLVRALAADPRVREVRDVTFGDDDPAVRRPGHAEVVVELITGESATLAVDAGR
jgi:hypothetical protein